MTDFMILSVRLYRKEANCEFGIRIVNYKVMPRNILAFF